MREEIKEQLIEMAEEGYREFHKKLVPNIGRVFGIRLPKLRQIAKKVARKDAEGYLREIWEALELDPDAVYYEEKMLFGLVIGYAKFTDQERIYWLERFVPYIDNWAVCDSCCGTYKWIQKDLEFWWDYLLICINRNTEYSIRFAVVCMLDYYVNDHYIEEIFSLADQIRHEGYYVKMAVAWAISVCYVKYPEQTDRYLQTDRLDVFTHNKAIQKICESYRVSKEQKQKVRTYKRA